MRKSADTNYLHACLRCLIQALVGLCTAAEQRDYYGDKFIFPEPFCKKTTYFKLQLATRYILPAPVTIKGRITRFAELHNSRTKTIYLPCCGPLGDGSTDSSVYVYSTTDISVHVLSEGDSYPVPPVHTLGLNHILLSIAAATHPHSREQTRFASIYFVSIAFAFKNTCVIVEPSRNDAAVRLHHKTVPSEGNDKTGFKFCVQKVLRSLTLTSEDPLTGVKVTSDKPVCVVTGVVDDETTTHIEISLPIEVWGKNYMLPFFYEGGSPYLVTVSVLAVENATVKIQTASTGNSNTHVLAVPGGSSATLELGALHGTVAVTSDQRISVLFHVHSEAYYPHYLSLRMWLAVAPVEQYSPDPCWGAYQCGVTSKTTVIAGLAAFKDRPLKLPNVNVKHLELGAFWVAILNHYVFRDINSDLHLLAPGLKQPIWYLNLLTIQRSKYFINILVSGARLSILDPGGRSNMTAGDEVDNDSDGLVDEELLNGKDDDGDGLRDEDLFNTTDLACKARPNMTELKYFPENKNLHAERYELQWDKPKGTVHPHHGDKTDLSFLLSTGLALASVISFFLVVWAMDCYFVTVRGNMMKVC